MAVEVGKETITRGRDGRMRIAVQWLTDTRAEAINAIPATHEGLVFAGTRAQPLTKKEGKYVTSANYEGITIDPDPSQDQYEIVGEDREIKIEEFPDRELLKEEFNAYEEDGKLKFPSKLFREKEIGSGLTLDSYKGGLSNREDNPLFNVTTYPVEYELATWRMVRLKVPRSVEKLARTVVKKLPSGFDYKGDAQAWYVRPLRRRKIGSAWEITVEFQEIDSIGSLLNLKTLMENKVRNRSVLDTFFN